MKKITLLKKIKLALMFFIIALVLSGATAIPIDWELNLLLNYFSSDGGMYYWLSKVLAAYIKTKDQYPFLLYGYDWLAFAHFVLAILFIGPYKDPVRNIWVIEFGLIACVLIIPFAFITGYLRSIPIGWRLIDCSFGVVGFTVLRYCHTQLKKIFPSLSNKKLQHESI
jgi:hypothetical protein